MPEIEILVMSGQNKGEWVVMWAALRLSPAEVVKKMSKRPCFHKVHGDKTRLYVTPAHTKERQAMTELMNYISPNLTSQEPALKQLIMHARAIWYDEN